MVRHGQASYMSEDYDRLSTIGEEQAIKLGEFWVRHEIQFDACFQGPAQRHARTAEIAADVVKAAGLPWPEAEIIEDVDEFDAFRLARLLAPRLVEVDPGIRKLNDDFIANRHTPEGGRSLQKLFEAVARMWSSGQYDSPDFESWSQFPRTRSACCRTDSSDVRRRSECRCHHVGRTDCRNRGASSRSGPARCD